MKKLMIIIAMFIGLQVSAMQQVEEKEIIVTQVPEVVASQVAPDGEIQITFADGTDLTIPADKEEVIVDEQPSMEEVQEKIEKEPAPIAPEVKAPEVVEVPEVKEEITPEIEVEEVIVAPEVDTTKIVTLADGSSVVYNVETNLYTFYPAVLGDWFYEFDNGQELQWAIETYQEIAPQIGRVENIEVINQWSPEESANIVELSDGSSLIYNYEKNLYAFYPAHMGDWFIELNNMQELTNVVTTYYDIVTNWI